MDGLDLAQGLFWLLQTDGSVQESYICDQYLDDAEPVMELLGGEEETEPEDFYGYLEYLQEDGTDVKQLLVAVAQLPGTIRLLEELNFPNCKKATNPKAIAGVRAQCVLDFCTHWRVRPVAAGQTRRTLGVLTRDQRSVP